MPLYSMIEVTTGAQTSSGALCKCHVFHTPRYPSQRGMTELYLSAAIKDPTYGEILSKVGFPVIVSAVEGVKQEAGGTWTTQPYNVREGEILKVFGQSRKRFNGLLVTACQFIVVRAAAPMNYLSVQVPAVEGSTRQYVGIKGRFDVLTLQEAITKGVVVAPHFEGNFSQINTSVVFEVEELEPETAPKQVAKVAKVVQDAKGQKRVILAPTRKRSLELD